MVLCIHPQPYKYSKYVKFRILTELISYSTRLQYREMTHSLDAVPKSSVGKIDEKVL